MDELTRLGDTASLETLLGELAEQHAACSLICIDIDHMKAFNLHNGHDVGDQLLCETASIVLANIDKSFRMFRVAGNEFVVVAPDLSLNCAVELAEHLRALIRETELVPQVEHCGDSICRGPVDITASIGVVCTDLCDSSFLELAECVHQEMIQAKEAGRDRVCSSLFRRTDG